LVGLSRVNGNIEALVAVGDKHQLPPYNPNQNHTGKKNGSYHRQRRQAAPPTKIKSILDVSRLKIDGGTKIKLTIQYRVPRDIAAVLNDRIYKGDYTTPAVSNVQTKGFCLLDVQSERNEKYLNRDEVQICLQMVKQLLNEGDGNIMLLTPVREIIV
jgi:superfamily I DNA and/or RNA helicase